MEPLHPAKVEQELSAHRFQMLEDLAVELAGEVLFPTCFDLVVNLKTLLKDPEVTLNKVTAAVRADPLISSKLLALANSAAYSNGQPLKEVKAAIERLGLTVVRSTSLGIAMRQMLMLRDIAAFGDLASQLWQHSLQTASACFILASRMTRLNPDEAYFAGLVHDIGAFYMLYRATQYPELVARPESLKHLVVQWHESIGSNLLAALHVPEDVIEATRDHDCLREAPEVPRNLRDIVYLGNFLAGSHFEWLYQDVDGATINRFALGSHYVALHSEIREHARLMATAVA